MLFVHGDRDPLVTLASGRRVYDKAPWPKAFLTLCSDNHVDPYLDHTNPAFATVANTTTDFLRWSLYGDAAAKTRLSGAGEQPKADTFEDRL